MSALSAVMYREGKIRATNALFIFWDVVYPLGYLLVFGVGMNKALGFSGLPTDYHAFFLAGVLGMAGFGCVWNGRRRGRNRWYVAPVWGEGSFVWSTGA